MTESNDQSPIAQALRTLERESYDVKALWREYEARLAARERGSPTEDDARYTLPLACPDMTTHLAGGTNQELAPEVMWEGLSYTLSPGQRAVLRERYALTPTQTVTVVMMEPWPGTRHPRRVKLRSDVHIDPRHRRHVLSEVVISDVGTFFRLSAERDAEVERDGSLTIERALVVGEIANLRTEERWAVEDLCGVKLDPRGKVEVTRTSEEKFTMLCLKSGVQATVPRKEFFALAEEYVTENMKHFKMKGSRKSKSFDATPGIDALLKEMGVGS